MNPTDLFEFSTTLVRNGPEVVVAFVAGLVFCWLFLWKFGFLGDKELKKKVVEADERLRDKEHDLAVAKADLIVLRSELEAEQEQREQAEQDREEIENKAAEVKGTRDRYRSERNQARAKLIEAAKAVKALRDKCAEMQSTAKQKDRDINQCRKAAEDATGRADAERGEKEKFQSRYRKKCRQHRQLLDQLADVAEKGGRIWERPLGPGAPAFVALGERRRCPIIAILNLKGGVGKTTITLNLAGALAKRGSKVVMVDCDHQRSLTSLCIKPSKRKELHATRQTLQHYLLDKADGLGELQRCLYPLPYMDGCSILANTASLEGIDGLANVEERLMFQWLASVERGGDIRLSLRAAFHGLETASPYDYVLLDCPPRLTTACINALAACDYVLIPVQLDATSASNPLPLLLENLARLNQPHVFPDFKVLGVVANRVHANVSRSDVWEDLANISLTGAWKHRLHRFDTQIKQSVVFAKAAKVLVHDNDHAIAAWKDAAAKEAFNNLTDEVLQRIHDEAPLLASVRA